ncbi:MAG: hypothetical protein EHM58_10570 [Ignavibacteriae bacterium]|nr:MAG: hypothetical protein EHM58_10570 [Ignavibacteriota bacterium]
MEKNEKICDKCRFYFSDMKEIDLPLLIRHNPELNNTFNHGQKMCVKKDKFVYKNETCGCYCGW